MSHFLLELPFTQTAVFIGLVPAEIFFLRKPVAESFGILQNPLWVSVKLLQSTASCSSTIFDLVFGVDEIFEPAQCVTLLLKKAQNLKNKKPKTGF